VLLECSCGALGAFNIGEDLSHVLIGDRVVGDNLDTALLDAFDI